VVFTPDGLHIAAVSGDRSTLQVFDSKGHLKWTYSGGNTLLQCPAFAPDGSMVAVTSWDDHVAVLDGKTGRRLKYISNHWDPAWIAVFSHDSHRLAWGDGDFVRVADVASNSPEMLLTGHSGGIVCLEFSPDDTRLLSGSQDGTVRLWDPVTARELLRLGSGQHGISGLAFDNRARHIFTADDGGNVTVYGLGGER
jgi:WD40 repeat protein